MLSRTLQKTGLLVAFTATCGIAHAADDRPHALAPGVTASYGKHAPDPRFHGAADRLQHWQNHHFAWDDHHGWHGGHPASPE